MSAKGGALQHGALGNGVPLELLALKGGGIFLNGIPMEVLEFTTMAFAISYADFGLIGMGGVFPGAPR